MIGNYILKEYGSWAVFIFSYLIGLLGGGRIGLGAFFIFISLFFYINSKQSFTRWLRGGYQRPFAVSFAFQMIVATVVMIGVLKGAVLNLMPFAVVPLIYGALFLLAGEHMVLTEIAGFAALTLSTVITGFTVSGEVDMMLYTAVTLFFVAGVFKVRVQLRKRMVDRALMVLYVVAVTLTYHLIGIPLIALIPMTENIVFSATLYRVKLRLTGWIEVAKGLVFFIIIVFFR